MLIPFQTHQKRCKLRKSKRKEEKITNAKAESSEQNGAKSRDESTRLIIDPQKAWSWVHIIRNGTRCFALRSAQRTTACPACLPSLPADTFTPKARKLRALYFFFAARTFPLLFVLLVLPSWAFVHFLFFVKF